jgi:hypothetical protein
MASTLPADVRAQVLVVQKEALPKNAVAITANYTLALLSRLTRFLDYLEFELWKDWQRTSNGPYGLVGKNCIHIGGGALGPNAERSTPWLKTTGGLG